MSVSGSPGSGRALRLDPFALPARFEARDAGADGQIRQIELDRERVVTRRAVAGIRMKISTPVSQFRGVSMRLLPPEGGEPAAVAVVLEHRDAGLSVPLFMTAEADDLMAEWKSWARTLGLPQLVEDDGGALRQPFGRMGGLEVRAPAVRRRRRGAVKWRRPRFLMRRKTGRAPAEPVIHRGEREIIARS